MKSANRQEPQKKKEKKRLTRHWLKHCLEFAFDMTRSGPQKNLAHIDQVIFLQNHQACHD